MTARDNALGDFLRARREQLTPEQVGMSDFGRRRVPGLRREELALLAGVSAPYYARLEQGRDRRPSDEVLDALARALQLEDEATRHLHALAEPAPLKPRRRPTQPERASERLQRMVERHVGAPAYVLGRTTDVLAGNRLAEALHPSFRTGHNLVRDFFLVPEARAGYLDSDLERIAGEGVATLRSLAAADLDDPQMTALVGELSLKSEQFRRLWSRHQVREKVAGVKHFQHPLLGKIELDYETFAVSGADRQLLLVFHAAPDSPGERALALLSTIAADGRQAGRTARAL